MHRGAKNFAVLIDDFLFFIQQLALLFFEFLDVFGRDVEVSARASSYDRAL